MRVFSKALERVLKIYGRNFMNQFSPGQNVPIINTGNKPLFLPVVVQITSELNDKLKEFSKTRGIDGQSLIFEIVTRGLASIMREELAPIARDSDGNIEALKVLQSPEGGA